MARELNRGSAPHVNISLDPSTTTIGVAVWNYGLLWENLVPPIEAFSISSNLDKWDKRVRDIGELLWEHLDLYTVRDIYIELPNYRDDYKGQTAARSESLTKLCIAAGYYAPVLGPTFPHDQIHYVGIMKWKGNLSKSQTEARVTSKLGDVCQVSWTRKDNKTGKVETKQIYDEGLSRPSDDVWDAVGLGLWAKGYF